MTRYTTDLSSSTITKTSLVLLDANKLECICCQWETDRFHFLFAIIDTKLKLGASMPRRVLPHKNDGGAPRTF